MNRKVKKCIKYYLKNISSREYKNHIEKSEKMGRVNHQKYVEEKEPQYKDRVDYYDNYEISSVMMFDVLSNEGIVKLLKKLYSLPKRKFKVKCNYRKPSLKNKYDYIHLQYSSAGYGSFAEIELNGDKYIKSIKIRWSQINSYFAFMEYSFTLKKILNDELYNEFIYDNLKTLNARDFLVWYNLNKQNKRENYSILDEMQITYLPLIFQHYITSYLYSEKGKTNPLINLIYKTRKEPIIIDNIYLFYIESFYNKKENYIITRDNDGVNNYLLAGNSKIPYFNVCRYISDYGNNFYYKLFGKIELRIFEQEFSKFITGRKKIIYNSTFMRLHNKLQSLSNYENRRFFGNYVKLSDEWDFYHGNEKKSLDDYNEGIVDEFEGIYRENFSYLKLLSEINTIKSNRSNNIVVTIVAIIAMIISLIALIK